MSEPERSDGAELRVEIDVPEGVTDDELLAVIGDICATADATHRAAGGSGLEVERVEVYEENPKRWEG